MAEIDDLGRVADELAIRNTLALIAQYSDDGPMESYGARFTPDAVWEMTGVPTRHGREQIVAAGVDRRAAGVTGPGSGSRHVVTTVSVTVDGDVAVVVSYWMFYTGTEGEPRLESMGKYRDLLVRNAAGWQVRHRHITRG